MELSRAFEEGNLKTSVWINFQPKSSCSVVRNVEWKSDGVKRRGKKRGARDGGKRKGRGWEGQKK